MPGAAYADTSFLVSIYRSDGNRPAAYAFMARHSPNLLFLPLHRVELRNSLRVAENQGWISAQERQAAFKKIEEDLQEGFLHHTPIVWSDVCRRADKLSEKHMVNHGQRTIDLLHVAAAIESGERLFLSFDKRQRGLAQAAGLTVKP